MKQWETEALEAYKIYFDSYIKGDENAIASLLEEDYTQIGSAEAEVFFNKKDALQFLKDTIDQVAGKTSIRNRILKTGLLDQYVLIIDLFDIYVFTGNEWAFYSRFRASTLMEKINGEWKFIHQHSSVPDMRTDEGENIGIEKIAAENLLLKDAIKRRTIELEQKNHELEIESSLERVRTVAMSMQQPEDMLDVCRIISKELQALAITNIRNVQTAVFYEKDGIYLNYEYFAFYDHKVVTKVEYNLQPDVNAFVNKMLLDPEAFFTTIFEGNKLAEWIAYQQEAGQFVDPKLHEVDSLHYYFYSIGPGALGISTYAPLDDADLAVFKRFRNVFELAYRRFVDIELAIAQAREARIEASLERVRAQAMSMRKSASLLDVCEVVYAELKMLGFGELRNAMINIHDDEKQSFLNYDYSDEAGKTITHHFYNSHPVIEKQVLQIRTAEDAFSETVFAGKDLEDWKQFRKEKGEPGDPKADSLKALYYYFYSIGTGSIGVSTYGSITEEKRILLKRFRNVFDLAYQRFRDIQLAEAQAKEAQIELALERVRARTMAMQSSSELADTAYLFFEQFRELGEAPDQMTIGIVEEEADLIQFYMTMQGKKMDKSIKASIHEPTLMHKLYSAWKENKRSLVVDLSGKELQDYLNYRNTLSNSINVAPDKVTDQRRVINAAFFSKGFITFSSPDPRPEESIRLLERFTVVFNQTYTRFLDLQKAEAQAREGQIELALERIRARTMSMQKSEELAETVYVLFQQFRELGENPDQATIGIINEAEQVIEYWVTMYGNQTKRAFKFSINEPHVTSKIYQAWKDHKKSLVIDLGGNALSEFMAYRAGKGGAEINPNEKRRVINVAFFSAGLLNVQSNESPSKESLQLLERFAKVFEQTYTRFLDLQKAEAQAKEAEIELALERVRARTMAMQKSTELAETSALLFGQLNTLVPELWTCGFVLCDRNKTTDEWWLSGGSGFMPDLILPNVGDPLHSNIYRAWMNGDSFYKEVIEGKPLQQHYEWLMTIPSAIAAFDAQAAAGIKQPVWQQLSCAFFSKGYLVVITEKPCEEAQIFKRFAKVFEQTYTRFLDLQKAEAQAREGQVELALERVRARTMAMQHSDELKDAAALLFQQAIALGVPAYSCGYNIWEKNDKTFTSWMSSQDGSIINGVPDIPLTEDANFIRYVDSKQKNEQFFVLELRGERMQEHYTYLKTIPAFKGYFDYAVSVGFDLPETQIHHIANFLQGNLLFITLEPCPEYHEVFKRFASVFEQTYTRFLDLQKAEAQAREGQIELALERVRARTMAMQKSEELQDATLVLFRQFIQLGERPNQVSICIFDEEVKTGEMYLTLNGEKIDRSFSMEFEKDVFVMNKVKNAFLEKKQNFSISLAGKELMEYNQWRNALVGMNRYDETHEVLHQTWNIFSVFFSRGILAISSDSPTSGETKKLLERFARVFDGTFTRFLDLQKAETQAREAQIQLALERVRARTMAMQHSDELQDAAILLFGQMKVLDIQTGSCGFNILDQKEKTATVWMSSAEGGLQTPFKMPHTESSIYKHVLEAMKNGEDLLIKEVGGKTLEKHFDYLSTLPGIGNVIKQLRETGYEFPRTMVYHFAFFKNGYLSFHLHEHHPETHEIFKRFAKVFEQTYTRFLDLQKAEAQAREAQIEASLERVRSRSMGMQKSEELKEVIQVVYDQLVHLNIKIEHCGFVIDYKARDDYNIWVADPLGVPSQVIIPYFDCIYYNSFNKAKEKGEDFFATHLSFEEKNSFYHKLFEYIPGLPEESKEFYFNCPGLAASTVLLDNVCLYIENFSGTPYTDEENKTLMRFGKVFQQTYTRFLDLQRVEEQARESQVEAALERVRSRTMAMQKSSELQETNAMIFQQLKSLNIPMFGTGIHVCHPGQPVSDAWIYDPLKGALPQIIYEHTHDNLSRKMYDGWKRGETFLIETVQDEELKEHFDFVLTLVQNPEEYTGVLPRFVLFHLAYNSHGYLSFVTEQQCPQEYNVFKRFSKVFEQTYTRFLDLQKAEAQAREAQIQLALERVRARTMAMHRSDEIVEVMGEVIRKLKELDVKLLSANLFVFTEGASDVEVWTANPGGSNSTRFMLPISSGPQFPFIIDKMKKGEDLFAHSYTFEEKNIFFTNLFTNTNYRFVTDERKKYILESPGYNITVGISKNIALQLNNYSATAFTDEENDINVRFAKVFEQSYTRFLDLQRAEAQAREAKIEAALERVRSKTMAMHKSKDVTSATKTMFDELKKLGIDYLQCGVANIHNNRTFAVFGVTDLPGGNQMSGLGIFGMDEHPIWQRWFESWVKKEEVFMAYLSGKEKEQYFHNIQNHRNYLPRQIIHFPDNFFQAYYFEQGALWTYSLHKHSKPEKEVMERFAKSFSLTFRRYQDLKKAEAQALEAVKRASVDRVRAEIASMRTTNDLERIQPLIWNELTTLGVPFMRCGVFIMDEERQQVHTFLSTPEGKAIATLHAPFDFHLSIIKNGVAHWRKKEIYKEHWDAAAFTRSWKALASLRENSGDADHSEQPPENLYLHLTPFLQGMLYVGNNTPLHDEALQLVQNLADAFATAYARYEDFNKLESAKQQVEKTLVDLKQAQAQLVQSEKMASLGELTAGIAHEIQNPLNFVNNFSEVNKELISELVDEVDKGNTEEVKAIAKDIRDNEEKINHHGKRADAIVKGMLQHSRTSTGSKEPTDINALADEYLRLSYHARLNDNVGQGRLNGAVGQGLRAKDKTLSAGQAGFNATIKTDFDPSIGSINIIPQDIGRVLLNLYNNAFYAVTEKTKKEIPGYEPTVEVNTKKEKNKIIISVKDNGNGIPQKIADKIFQPFFTTKPTGEGTGLGLSLSYDIVKAHGGEIIVETKEGVGSEFIINLPIFYP